MTSARPHQLAIRLTVKERARLDFLAKHYGVTAAGVLRMILKQKTRELVAAGELPPEVLK